MLKSVNSGTWTLLSSGPDDSRRLIEFEWTGDWSDGSPLWDQHKKVKNKCKGGEVIGACGDMAFVCR